MRMCRKFQVIYVSWINWINVNYLIVLSVIKLKKFWIFRNDFSIYLPNYIKLFDSKLSWRHWLNCLWIAFSGQSLFKACHKISFTITPVLNRVLWTRLEPALFKILEYEVLLQGKFEPTGRGAVRCQEWYLIILSAINYSECSGFCLTVQKIQCSVPNLYGFGHSSCETGGVTNGFRTK